MNMSDLNLETELFGEKLVPIALAPVGLTGMYARRGENYKLQKPRTQ